MIAKSKAIIPAWKNNPRFACKNHSAFEVLLARFEKFANKNYLNIKKL